MRLNFQNNRNNDSATFDKAHGTQGEKTAESRYLIFKTDLFKLYWTIGPEILLFASLKCHESISMPLFTDQARNQTWSVANRQHVTILGLSDTSPLSLTLVSWLHWRFCQKRNFESRKIQICYFWVGSLHVRRPDHAPTLIKGQVDVFPLVFVSADNINVTALVNTDLFMKIWFGQLHAADPKAAYDPKINST